MSKVVLDVSMSLDGYSAGPDVRDEEPMGDGGERLHGWTTAADGGAIHQSWNAAVGACLIGRRTFDVGQSQWGGTPWPGVPTFVVTHRTREDLLGDNGGTFYFDGLEAAARRAKEAAGDDEVMVLGAEVAQGLLREGLLDEVRLHLVPLLLGEGTPLFAGVQADLVPEGEPVAAGGATHQRYRVPTP